MIVVRYPSLTWGMALLMGCTLALGCGATESPTPAPEAPVSTATSATEGTPVADKPSETVVAAADAAATSVAPIPTAAETAPATSGPVLLGSTELFTGTPGTGPLKVAAINAWLAEPQNHQPLEIELPFGLLEGASQVKGVAKNPLTRAKIELGRQLYFDTRLSADNTISCASCHNPDDGWTAHTRVGVGIRRQEGGRNNPVSYNRILSDAQFWDGRAGSLEEQAIGPIANPIEMGHTHDACVAALKKIEGYRLQFEKIFGVVTIEAVGQALASFERAIVTGPTPYDYQKRLDAFKGADLDSLKSDDPDAFAEYQRVAAEAKQHPMSESAQRGMQIYFSEKGSCSACHVGANLTDELYHNLGVGMDAAEPDLGRYTITKEDKDRGAFKTPTIRNVALTAPYMHDGSQKTLEEVVDWYAKGGHPNPDLSPKIKKLDLSEQDKKDLVEFMKACTGEFPKIETGRLPE